MKLGSHALWSRGWGTPKKARFNVRSLTAPCRFDSCPHSENSPDSRVINFDNTVR